MNKFKTKSLKNYIIESLNKSSNIQNLNVDDIKEITTKFLKTGKIVSVKDDGEKFIVKLDDDNFDTELDELINHFQKTYNVDVDYDIETDSIEIHKKKFPRPNLIKIDNNQDNKKYYSNMSIDKLKKELIGKLLFIWDKMYGKGFDDGREIVDVIKRGSNVFIKYMEGSDLYGKTERELNIKNLDQNDSQYYEYKISKNKVSKAEQRKEERKRHKVQDNGLTPNDEEIIELAYATTYKSSRNLYLNAVDTDKARKIIEYIFSNPEIEWED